MKNSMQDHIHMRNTNFSDGYIISLSIRRKDFLKASKKRGANKNRIVPTWFKVNYKV